MAIVTISEAARLTGKSRQTLHRHIVTGKLSKCNTDTNGIGIDTSELLRVYKSIKNYSVTPVKDNKKLHQVTGNVAHITTDKDQSKDTIQQLEKELEILKVKNVKLDLEKNKEFINHSNTGILKRLKKLFN